MQSFERAPEPSFDDRVANCEQRLETLKAISPMYSYEEYLAMAIDEALTAVKEGNYGVGALMVYRYQGMEYFISARNNVFTGKHFTAHAECEVLDIYELMRKGSMELSLDEENRIAQHLLRPRPITADLSRGPAHTFTDIQPPLEHAGMPSARLISTIEFCWRCIETFIDFQRVYDRTTAPNNSEKYSTSNKVTSDPRCSIGAVAFGALDSIAGGLIKKNTPEAEKALASFVNLDELATRENIVNPVIVEYAQTRKDTLNRVMFVLPKFFTIRSPDYSALCLDIYNMRRSVDQIDYESLVQAESAAGSNVARNFQRLSRRPL